MERFTILLYYDRRDAMRRSKSPNAPNLARAPYVGRASLLTNGTVCSGDSRIKKVGGPLRGQGKSRGANINV